MLHSDFANNSAVDGGAVAVYTKSIAVVASSRLQDNFATDHGANIAVSGSMLQVTDTILIGGKAPQGGAISAISSILLLDTSFVYGNGVFEAIDGGALLATDQSLVGLSRCIFRGNRALRGGVGA